MATNIKQKFSIDLSGVIENSITSIKAIRRSEQNRKISEVNRAVANGLPYSEVVGILEKQLADENSSGVSDADFVETLKTSIAETKKLDRYQKFNIKYQKSLTELAAGKVNEEDFATNLRSILDTTDDPELRLKIQKELVTAEKNVKTYKDNILTNQVSTAIKDKTESVLNTAIERVKLARTNALIGDNQDDVTMYDEYIVSLNSQLNVSRIQNAVNNISVKNATTGFNPVDKLGYINSEIQKSDSNVPIMIGGVTFSSAQQYWSLERDKYLSGDSELFGNFFNQLKASTDDTINIDSKVFGTNTQAILDSVSDTYNQLRSKPEMVPFLDKLNAVQTSAISSAVNTIANKIVEIGSQNRDYDNAATQLINLKKYGVDVTQQEVVLRNRNISEVEAGKVKAGKIDTLETPEITPEIVTPGATPGTPSTSGSPAQGDSIVNYLNSVGRPSDFASRSVLAKEKGIENYSGKAEQNLQLLGIIRNQPLAPSTPSTPTPAPIAGQAPGVGTTVPVMPSTPTATPVPVTPSTPSTYTGNSVVDYLKSQKQDSSFASRAKLAAEKGMTGYKGDAKQNENLLKLLRG